MNYLGHAYLSMGDEEILCGNMMGDFVKGRNALQNFPERIKKGLLLHRHIDYFTDQHVQIAKAKQIFRPFYGLYSGAVVDIIMDYFIANDSTFFNNQNDLDIFAKQVYSQLNNQLNYFPDQFLPYFKSMVSHNWLSKYRSQEGLRQSLLGLKRRANNIKEIDTAIILLLDNKAELNDYYTHFISDIISFVKIELEV